MGSMLFSTRVDAYLRVRVDLVPSVTSDTPQRGVTCETAIQSGVPYQPNVNI